MSYHVRRTGREQQKAKSRRLSLQKPNGVISPRVRKVGGEHFAIVCVDPAKLRLGHLIPKFTPVGPQN